MVRAFVDSWLPEPVSFRPITFPCSLHDRLYVADLISQGTWNSQLLSILFYARD